MKTCFEQLNMENTCRVIVLTGSGRAFSTGKFFLTLSMKSFIVKMFSGIDITYLSTVGAESVEIDDIARKALHIRSMIQRTQESLRAVDRVNKKNFNFSPIYMKC